MLSKPLPHPDNKLAKLVYQTSIPLVEVASKSGRQRRPEYPLVDCEGHQFLCERRPAKNHAARLPLKSTQELQFFSSSLSSQTRVALAHRSRRTRVHRPVT